MGSIHDRFKDDRDSKVSAREFFHALGHSTKASGMGRRVYEQADKGTYNQEYKEQGTFVGQLGERRQYEARPAPPTLPSINSPSDVLNALGPNQQTDANYAAAVLESFVRSQLETGRSEAEVSVDLNELEKRQYSSVSGPQSDVFTYIRQTFRLEAPPAYGNAPPTYH
ncbi:uncharacterized protein EHS24_004069 [Apiotrichum porosum]|uniref:Uncharacterized protein n=1 Tax=Apiotrichum porosum TaxID=105984 RepID=A0A427Y467_9TREE|nr:uncharacterized protein EHS24_004069 [Apiotrichum porosum]RSH85884.1 hypothetical protein EHS24_004069 [Apiotrichum porosum]